jgi:glutamyl-tRNA synthetase
MTSPVSPRVRFAPSPSGYLHIGGARTALFNWLFARRNGGTFILRIEDTDQERSSQKMIDGILESLRWLGLDWDEGPGVEGPHAPYYQSQRLNRYHAMAERLVEERLAYYCYCCPEALRKKREAARIEGGLWKYDRTCYALTSAEIEEFESIGLPRAIRFRVADGVSRFEDLVRGLIEFDLSNIEDFVLLRSDHQPTYHLSVVVDDIDMEVTHVIRGEDHISNTPKQQLLYEAFKAEAPRFGHVPLILGADKKRLSKRHGATSVTEYRRLGYVPEAMVNFLAFLGWSPGNNQELFSTEELIREFSLEGIGGGNALFNSEKLDWFSGQHIARLSAEVLADRIEPLLREAGFWHKDLQGARRVWLLKIVALFKTRARRLSDFVDQGRFFFTDDLKYEQQAIQKHLSPPGLSEHLLVLRDALCVLEPFEKNNIENIFRGTAEVRGIKAATLIHATRVGLTGKASSPGLFEIMEILGKEQTLKRLERLNLFMQQVPRCQA